MSKVHENTLRARKRNSVNEEKFYFCFGSTGDVQEISLDEIFNGNASCPGLLSFTRKYVKETEPDVNLQKSITVRDQFLWQKKRFLLQFIDVKHIRRKMDFFRGNSCKIIENCQLYVKNYFLRQKSSCDQHVLGQKSILPREKLFWPKTPSNCYTPNCSVSRNCYTFLTIFFISK